ncbi:S9 family peptidase, partial [Mycobacterium sp. ITM-2017-0098]
GPAQEHLFSVGDAPPADLTPAPGDGLRDAHFDVSRDGTFIITTWQGPAPAAARRTTLVRIDVPTGGR